MLIYWNHSPPEKFGLQMFRLSRFREQGLQPLMADLPQIRFQETQSPASHLHQCRREIPWTVCGRSSRSRNEDLHLLIHLFGYKSNSHGSCRRPRHRQVFDSNPMLHCSTRPTALVFLRQRIYFPGSKKADQTKTTDVGPRLHQRSAIEPVCRMEAQPPSTPHFGGMWERLVQCVKRALLLYLGSANLTPDVFATIVSEVECLVNSRPLIHVRSNQEDDNPLTTNNFLLGRPFCNVPGNVFNATLTSKNSVWTHVEQRFQPT